MCWLLLLVYFSAQWAELPDNMSLMAFCNPLVSTFPPCQIPVRKQDQHTFVETTVHATETCTLCDSVFAIMHPDRAATC